MRIDRTLISAMRLTVAYASLTPGSSRSLLHLLFKIFAVLFVGFCAGVLLSESGFVYEAIRVRVEIVKTDTNASTGDVLEQLLSSLPHVNRSLAEKTATAFVVPDIVHYFWFSEDNTGRTRPLSFINYLSVLSVHRNHRPVVIYFHCHRLPSSTDQWWSRLWHDVPITVVYLDDGSASPRVGYTSLSSVGRELARQTAIINSLLMYGGLYVDASVLVAGRLDRLRRYDACLVKESESTTAYSVLSARPNSTFLPRTIGRDLTESIGSRELSNIEPDTYCYGLMPELPGTSSGIRYAVRIPAERSGWNEESLMRSSNDTLTLLMRDVLYGPKAVGRNSLVKDGR